MVLTSSSTQVIAAQARAVDYLLRVADNGSWGYHLAQKPAIEATAWCAIACRQADTSTVESAINFLLTNQNVDGGWSTACGIGDSDWSSGPATLALRILTADKPMLASAPKIKQALPASWRYLFNSRIDPYTPVWRLLFFLCQGPAGLQYGRGWPWTPGCWNWVEPTAYNLLALKIPQLPPQEEFKAVIEHAHRFLFEHSCFGGGWNHGSNYCLGHNLPPFAVTTAEALLALQDAANHPVVKQGLAYLASRSNQHRSTMDLAWSIMARSAYGENVENEADSLLNAQQTDGSFGSNLMVCGLATVALSCLVGHHPLLISR